jgi:hypothetical protein
MSLRERWYLGVLDEILNAVKNDKGGFGCGQFNKVSWRAIEKLANCHTSGRIAAMGIRKNYSRLVCVD